MIVQRLRLVLGLAAGRTTLLLLREDVSVHAAHVRRNGCRDLHVDRDLARVHIDGGLKKNRAEDIPSAAVLVVASAVPVTQGARAK